MQFLIFLFTVITMLSSSIVEAKVSDIFMNRHSGKSYDPERQHISDEDIHALMEAARMSPSSHNDQPWNFIFCDKERTPVEYQKAFDSFKNTQKGWVKDAPLIIIVVARYKQVYNGKHNPFAEYDTGAASVSMSLQAADLGLMAHQVGGFDREKIKADFNLPEDHIPLTVILMGYEAPCEENSKPKERRPIHENFFLGSWGQPWENQ